MAILNYTQVLCDAFIERLSSSYRTAFGNPGLREHEYGNVIRAAAQMAVEVLATSDAPYHDVEHTMLVTLVGQEIIRGKLLTEGNVTSRDWAHFTVALLCHDIGYTRGVLPADDGDVAVVDEAGTTVTVPDGSTDAWLTPYHVERGKLFVRSRFSDNPAIDADIICESIENTRFPVPADSDSLEDGTWAGLVRAADLIGQMADPDYLRKLPALYYEFAETGANEKMGYSAPADLRSGYPNFFWLLVSRHINKGVQYLKATAEGRVWLSGLYSHVFYQEHRSAL